MRDQPALAIDDIGVGAFTDLQSGNHIPNQFEIDLTYRGAGIGPVWAIARVIYGSDALRK
jgi:hypothetical protein